MLGLSRESLREQGVENFISLPLAGQLELRLRNEVSFRNLLSYLDTGV